MKARRFFAFVAGVAMLFGVGCTKDADTNDSAAATISVSPDKIMAKLEGGEYLLTVTSNAAWAVVCDQEDVTIEPKTGANNGTVKVTLPKVDAARNFSITFEASKTAMMSGMPYQSTADAAVAVYQNEGGTDKVTTNVAEIRAALKALNPTETATAVSEEVASMKLVGVVAGSGSFGNMSSNKQISIQDDNANPHSGLTVRWDSTVELEHGSIIELSLANAKVQTYKGLLQLTPAQTATVVGRVSNLAPIEISYDEYNNYESQYVKLSGLIPGTADEAWYSGTSSFKTHNFTTSDGKVVVVYVSKYAKFASETIPNKMGSIAGIATIFNSDKQLLPQSLADIQLTEEIVEPEAVPATIAEVLTTGAGKYIVNNAWAVATYARGCLLTDESGAYILAYNPSETPAVGAVVSIEGTVSEYGGCLQFSEGSVITATSETKEVSHPTAEVLDGAAIDAYIAAPVVKYAEFTGVLTVSSNHYNVAVDGATVVGSISYPNTEIAEELKQLDGVPVKVTGYMIGKSTSNGTNYANIMATSVEADTSKPMLKANDITGVSADGVVDANANITVVGIDAVATEFDGAVVTAASVTGNVLTYSVSANETEEAREGWIELSAAGVETVKIAVKQLRKLPEGAGSYNLSINDITAISYAADWTTWSTVAADGSAWSGFAYKQTKCYQLSFSSSSDKDKNLPTSNQNKSNLLSPVIPTGKTITKITITPFVEGSTTTSNGRKFVVLPADFAYTTTVDGNGTEAVNAAYAVSEPTVKNSTTPIVIDLSGVENLPQQVQIRAILGAAYISDVKIDFE